MASKFSFKENLLKKIRFQKPPGSMILVPTYPNPALWPEVIPCSLLAQFFPDPQTVVAPVQQLIVH